MFGSRPEKNDPEIDKLNSRFTLIGPITHIKSFGKAEVFFIRVANSAFLESPQKSLPKSQLCRRPLTSGVAKHDPPK